MTLIDNHGRSINYVRLAVTDRCNLRCFYCMPAHGIDYVKRTELLQYEEMVRLVQLFVDLGIEKLRLTGGEPFLRKDLMQFLRMISQTGLKEIHITTNGTLTFDEIPELKELGVSSVNLSLDTLDRQRFHEITRRDQLPTVMRTLDRLLEYEIPTKINMVVMDGRNTQDIIPMARLAEHHPISIRYIEEMPFNGSGRKGDRLAWNFVRILEVLQKHLPPMNRWVTSKTSTSVLYEVEQFKGKIGIIAAYSRTFCGTCNRLRITPKGTMRTCLYGEGVFNIKDLLRSDATDEQIKARIVEAVGQRVKDGFEAEELRNHNPVTESMSTIGG